MIAWRTLSASSGPSTNMIAPPACWSPIRMAFPTSDPREYLLMLLCSRFFPSGVSSTACTPQTSPSALVAGKSIAGPSYMLGLNRATPSATPARIPRLFRYSSAGLTASLFSRDIGTLRSQAACAFAIFSARVSSSRISRSLLAKRTIRRSISLG